MQPSVVTSDIINIPGRSWTLVIASPLSDVDVNLESFFRRAMMWAGFVIISITAILFSSSLSMIRSRIRLERQRHEILARELNDARAIQLAWLPGENYKSNHLTIAAVNLPASHVSGDFYNWFDLEDGRTVVLIGDVTGHGMAAAFLMATTQLLVRTTFQRLTDPGEVMQDVNRQLCTQPFNGQFVTMVIMVLDPKIARAQIAVAGHAPPFVSTSNGFAPVEIEPQLVLGVDPDATYQTHEIPIGPTAMFVLHTDGVQDARSPDGIAFTSARLEENLRKQPHCPPHELRDAIIHQVKSHCSGAALVDDLTLVTVATINCT